MPYTVIENFKSGLVRNNTSLNMPPGSLYQADDVHVSQSGELEKRQDFQELELYLGEDNQWMFYGLVATTTKLYVFGSENL